MHISSLGIVGFQHDAMGTFDLTLLQLHRDIKLTNIFVGESYLRCAISDADTCSLDAKGDCKGMGARPS